MKKILLTIIACAAYVAAHATIVQTITLKNGSTMSGYFSKQISDKGYTFRAERSITILDSAEVRNPVEEDFDNLSTDWQEAAEKYNLLVKKGNKKTLTLSTVTRKDGTCYNGVYVFEEGTQVRFLDLHTRECELPFDTIVNISVDPRKENCLTGLNRCYTLKNGSIVEGQYLGEEVGKSITVQPAIGPKRMINPNDIIKIEFKRNNTNQSYFEQVPLLDVINLENGVVRGVIIERNFQSETGDYYLTIVDENNSPRLVKIADVKFYTYEKNDLYEEVLDMIVGTDEYYINRNSASLLDLSQYKTKDRIRFASLPNDYLKIANTTQIVLEYSSNNTTFTVAPRIAKLKHTGKYYEVMMSDMLTSSIVAKEQSTSINGTVKTVYQVPSKGLYVAYDETLKKCILFEIK